MCLFTYSCILVFECPMLVFNKGYTVSHKREKCGKVRAVALHTERAGAPQD